MATAIAIRIKPGEKGRKVMPHSEVCMHMRIAGKVMDFELLDKEYPSVQLYTDIDNKHYFSSPITYGEAGVHRDNAGFYYYPDR
jgi:hypothetical protein